MDFCGARTTRLLEWRLFHGWRFFDAYYPCPPGYCCCSFDSAASWPSRAYQRLLNPPSCRVVDIQAKCPVRLGLACLVELLERRGSWLACSLLAGRRMKQQLRLRRRRMQRRSCLDWLGCWRSFAGPLLGSGSRMGRTWRQQLQHRLGLVHR